MNKNIDSINKKYEIKNSQKENEEQINFKKSVYMLAFIITSIFITLTLFSWFTESFLKSFLLNLLLYSDKSNNYIIYYILSLLIFTFIFWIPLSIIFSFLTKIKKEEKYIKLTIKYFLVFFSINLFFWITFIFIAYSKNKEINLLLNHWKKTYLKYKFTNYLYNPNKDRDCLLFRTPYILHKTFLIKTVNSIISLNSERDNERIEIFNWYIYPFLLICWKINDKSNKEEIQKCKEYIKILSRKYHCKYMLWFKPYLEMYYDYYSYLLDPNYHPETFQEKLERIIQELWSWKQNILTWDNLKQKILTWNKNNSWSWNQFILTWNK